MGLEAPPFPWLYTQAQHKGQQAKIPTCLPISSWEGTNYILSHLLSEGPDSNWLLSDCNPPFWDTDGSWHTLNYGDPQRMQLEQFRKFEKLPRAWASQTDEAHIHKTTLVRLVEKVVLTMCRNHHRELRKMKKIRLCFKQKNKIKFEKQILIKQA